MDDSLLSPTRNYQQRSNGDRVTEIFLTAPLSLSLSLSFYTNVAGITDRTVIPSYFPIFPANFPDVYGITLFLIGQ